MTEYIPVNSVYVTQCFWPEPKFDYTLTVARPYGWVWGIPLQNRCSIGFSFKYYYRNVNFLEKLGYNGNASFFLEPLEATSISSMIMISKLCAGYVLGVNDSLDYINNVYTLKLKHVENMINLHYLAGSK